MDIGGLSSGQRFDRVEAALTRIEAKLDTKADRTELAVALARLEAVEQGTHPLARLYLRDFEDLQRRVDTLEERGSRNAREAVEEVRVLHEKVDRLDRASDSRTAIVKAETEKATGRYRLLGAVVGLAAIANTIVSIFTLAH